jgi:hypothetical protein
MGVGGGIILKWILNRMRWCGLDLCDSGQRQGMGCCESGLQSSGSIKCREFLDYLGTIICFSVRILLHGVGSLVSQSVGKFIACSAVCLFHFQDAKIEIEAIAVVGEIVDSTS